MTRVMQKSRDPWHTQRTADVVHPPDMDSLGGLFEGVCWTGGGHSAILATDQSPTLTSLPKSPVQTSSYLHAKHPCTRIPTLGDLQENPRLALRGAILIYEWTKIELYKQR